MLNFEHLSPADFECLCFALLVDLGAEAVDWRKGTTGESSPSDQGRDIECLFRLLGPGGELFTERRFIECKHHTRGVPPRELEGALAWAQAERPDVLHFMVSGFLSNPAKEFLESYKRNQRPGFRIVVWEQPQLTSQLSKRSKLLRNYDLAGPAPQLDLLHPVHVRFLSEAPVFGVQTLFDVLDKIEADERDAFLSPVLLSFTDFSVRLPRIGNESLWELMDVKPDYDGFRRKCLSLPLGVEFIAAAVVQVSLAMHFRLADTTKGDAIRENIERFIHFLDKKRQQGQGNPEVLDGIIAIRRNDLDDIDVRLEENYKRYARFCDFVLLPILEAPPERVTLPPEWESYSSL